MAKLTATETCHAVVLEALRIHGAVGYRAEAEIARLYRDAPMILIGEGTSEIQKTLVAQGLLSRWDRTRATAVQQPEEPPVGADAGGRPALLDGGAAR